MKKVLQPAYALYAATTFVTSFLLLFPAILVLSAGGKKHAHRRVRKLAGWWFRWWMKTAGIRNIVQDHPPEGHYVFIANHRSYMDNISLYASIKPAFRALGKGEGIPDIPLFGFFYKQLVLVVERDDAGSRTGALKAMKQHLEGRNSIAIFPEGTFNESEYLLKDFYDGAFWLAITTGTPICPIILPDTASRWHHSAWWKLWPGRNRVQFLPPVPVTGLSSKDTSKLKEHIRSLMIDALRKADNKAP